jgi:DNA-binding LytR/AlgR family response regulator
MTNESIGTPYFLIRDQSGGFQKVQTNELLYVKSVGNYLQFVTTEGNYTAHGSLLELIAKLANDSRFFQVHRSYVVNVDRLDHIIRDTISIQKQSIPIGPSFAEAFRVNFIQQYLWKL